MDNRHYDITSEGRAALFAAMTIAWDNVNGGTATHYADIDLEGIPTLVLFWGMKRDATKLPYPLTLLQAVDFVDGWLNQVKPSREPDHDGDNKRGFRVFCDYWGNLETHHGSFVGVQFAWAMYGK